MEAGLVQSLEGALLAAGEPLSLQRMAILFEEHERPSTEELHQTRFHVHSDFTLMWIGPNPSV